MGVMLGCLLQAKVFIDRHTKARTFQKKCRDPMPVQWAFLKELLHRHRHTDFGKKYDFSSVHQMEEFRDRVPIHTWEDLAPYIQEVQNGNHGVLFSPSEKLIMFAATSGTTGEPKYVPVTDVSYHLYGKYWPHVWCRLMGENPESVMGKALYFPGDPEEGFFDKIPYGAITAKAYAQQNFLTRALYPFPYQVAKIKNYEVRYYTIMRLALETSVTAICIANPSTIITLFKTTRERAREMIKDIREGRLKYQQHIPYELKQNLIRTIRPNPRRARELENIINQTGDFLPKDYWPSRPMSVVCFASGPLKLYLKQLSNYLEDYKVADFGLLTSEGRLSFPLGTLDQMKGCCLALETNFFEFIPEEQIELPHPKTLTLDQVKKGKRYFLLFTNYSGLYRYNISDLVEITGFYGKVPMVTFCNKGKHFSNITGEKLSEYQVTESVKKVGEKFGNPVEEFVFCLHWDESLPSYSLLTGNNMREKDPRILSQLVNLVDEELMKENCEYRAKRQSRRLGPLTLKVVNGHDYEEYENDRQKKAHNLSQYKHIFLVGDPEFEKQFHFSQQFASTIDPMKIR